MSQNRHTPLLAKRGPGPMNGVGVARHLLLHTDTS